MFTGIVEKTGIITGRSSNGGAGKITIRPASAFECPVIGESIAVNGCCLTLEIEHRDGTLTFHTLEETLRRTNLGSLPIGGKVNMERALRVGDRLGGHWMSGHVDTTARVLSMAVSGSDVELKIAAPPELRPYLVEKGSIAVDGISLTLVEVEEEYFTVHLIPVTLRATALGERQRGGTVNLEGDILGKYVRHQLGLAAAEKPAAGRVTMETLREAGFL